jgi:hypothetical protein
MKCQLLVLSLTLVAAAFSNVETKTCGRLIQQAFYNGPLISVSKLQSVDDCCAKCSAHEDCKLFVYGGAWKGNTATCSLLSDMTEHWDTPLGGPIFHTVLMDITPEECKTPVGSQCGNTNRTTCCPTGSYCQPWNSNFYQCLETPEKCEKMETDIDFYGIPARHIMLHLRKCNTVT